MDPQAAALCIEGFPRDFLAKSGQALRLELLGTDYYRRLVETYLAFEPRNSFQGLPPLKDEICVQWVEGMITTGINLIALSAEAGIVGHTAVFPINERKCEMLVVVWPRFQNIGIGTELTRSSVEIAAKPAFEKLWLPVDSTNLRARHIYLKCGFEYVSARQSRELDMVCDLTRQRMPNDKETALPKAARVPVPHFEFVPGTAAMSGLPVV
jgi:RimJ/RimL family protein N-acetyltransferase